MTDKCHVCGLETYTRNLGVERENGKPVVKTITVHKHSNIEQCD